MAQLFMIAAVVVVCGVSLSPVMNRIGVLQDAEYRARQSEINEVLRLSREIDEVLAIVSRQGSHTAESVQKMREAKRTLTGLHFQDALPTTAAYIDFSLARVEYLEGDFIAAEHSVRNALSLFHGMNEPNGEARSRLLLGTLLYNLGRRPEAFQEFDVIVNQTELLDQVMTVYGLALRNWLVAMGTEATSQNTNVDRCLRRLEAESTRDSGSPALAMLIDFKVQLANIDLSNGNVNAAKERFHASVNLCRQLAKSSRQSHFSHEVVDQRKLERALKLLSRLDLSTEATSSGEPIPWNWLYESQTESIAADPPYPSTLTAEFDAQAGLVLPWLDYEWLRPCVQEIISSAWRRVPITLIVTNELECRQASEMLNALDIPLGQTEICIASIESPWLRDMGPMATHAENGNPTYWIDTSNSLFNQSDRPQFDALPLILQRRFHIQRVPSSLVLQGGTVLANGSGLTFVSETAERLNTKTGFDSRRFTKELKRLTGASQIVSLKALKNEPSGHLDTFLTVISEDTVVVAQYEDPEHENAVILDENAKRLSSIRHRGKPLRVVRVPMPASCPLEGSDDEHFYSYTNVLFANELLLVPSWPGISRDIEDRVVSTYRTLLPDFEIKFVDCGALVGRGGALHRLACHLGASLPSLSSDSETLRSIQPTSIAVIP
ncbi:MAG: agmatine deiminase family protein [Aureliella sp.]